MGSSFVNILDGVGIAVVVVDLAGRIQITNKAAEHLLGATSEKTSGRLITELVYPEGGWNLSDLRESIKQEQIRVWSAKRVKFISSEEKVMRVLFAPLKDKQECCGIVITLWDITRQQREMEELRLTYDLLESVLNNIPDTVYFKDIHGRFIWINQSQAELLGLKSREDGIGKTDFDFFLPEHARSAWQDEQEIVATGKRVLDKSELVRGADGEFRWVSTSKVAIQSESGVISGIVGVSRDITERKRMEEELAYLNFHDKLTGLYNRAYFEEELRRLDVERMLPLSVIMGDLNGLKIINDAFGHDAGDRLLKEVASILKGCCRKEDMVARWGGDEFVILLPKTDKAMAERVCQRIRAEFQSWEWESVRPGISLGVATKTDPSCDIRLMVKQADQAMYRAKLLENRSTRRMLLANLKKTISEDQNADEPVSENLISLLASMVSIVDTYVEVASEEENEALAQRALSELVRCLHSQYDANVMQQIFRSHS